MKRVSADLFAALLLVGGDMAWRLVAKTSSDGGSFITLHISSFWLIWVCLIATGRSFAGVTILREQSQAIALVAKWLLILLGTHVFLCWLDTIWESRDTFKTVWDFTLFPLLIPSIVVSSGVYLAARFLLMRHTL